MKKLLIILSSIIFLSTTKTSTKIYYVENKEAALYDQILNGNEKTAYTFDFEIEKPMIIVARMYEDDIEIKNLKTAYRTLYPDNNKLLISLDATYGFFTFYSKGRTGRTSFNMTYNADKRNYYQKSFSNVTYIRKDMSNINEEIIPLIICEYEENGHTYTSKILLEACD